MTSNFFNNCIFVHTFQWTSEFYFFNFTFSSRKSQSQQKTSEKRLQYSFAQKTSPILQTSTHSVLKNTCSRNTAKNLSFSLYTFLCKHLVGVRKTIALHHFQTPKNCILEALWKQMSVYLKENFCFRDVVRFYLLLFFICWIRSLRRLAVWVSQNVLQSIFYNFGNSTIFQHFETSI